MKERTIRVGRPVPLIGVMCEPDKVDVSRPAVTAAAQEVEMNVLMILEPLGYFLLIKFIF